MKLARNQVVAGIMGLGLLIVVGIGIVSHRYTSSFISAIEGRKSSYEIVSALDSIGTELKNIDSAEQLFIKSGQAAYRTSYTNSQRQVRAALASLKFLTTGDLLQQGKFTLLESLVARRLDSLDKVIDARGNRGRWMAEKTFATMHEEKTINVIAKTLAQMRNAETGRIRHLSRLIKTGYRDTIGVILLSNLLAVCIVFLGALVFRLEFVRRRQAEEAVKRFSQSVEQSADLVMITDRSGRIEYVNKSVEAATGYSAAEVIGKTRRIWDSGKHDEKFFRDMRDTALAGRQFQAMVTNRKKNGDLCYVHETITPLRDRKGMITHMISTGRDVTIEKALEERIDYLAHFDAVTGLPNRMLFVSRLKESIMESRSENTHVAVLVLDIDRFKCINDVFGFAAGDSMLKIIAERISGFIKAGDGIGRIGSDEFGIVLHALAKPSDTAAMVRELMRRISQTILFKKEEIILTATVGIALFPNDGRKADTLVKKADFALAKAKAQGRNNYQFYTSDINVKGSEVIKMEKSLFTALQNDEYQVYYQPYCDLTTKRVAGVEALIKWNSGTHGLISPTQFIPTLEETGMIIDVGEWVLKTACQQIKKWGNGTSSFPVSVNLSLIQFRHKYLVDMVADTISEFGINPQRLALEITESIFMHDLEFTNSILKKLKDLGIMISVDDFGTGYSSLSYLKRLPVDNVKIDMSFVRDVTVDPDVASIVTAIVAMAKSLNLKTIAEGIETEEQRNILRLLRCDMGQGFYFSPALLPNELEKQLFKTG